MANRRKKENNQYKQKNLWVHKCQFTKLHYQTTNQYRSYISLVYHITFLVLGQYYINC